MSSNIRQARKDQKRRQQQRKEERAEQKEQNRLREAFNANDGITDEWLREILEVNDMEDRLNEFEIKKIRGILNKQVLLANLTDAEAHDARYKLQVTKLKIFGAFPPEESSIQGPVRAFLYDDEYENLTSLTADQRIAIDGIITSIQHMVTRGRGGFERKQLNTKYARTDKEDINNDGGKKLGLF